jgi:hypothetical protein
MERPIKLRTLSYLGTFALGAVLGAALLFGFSTRPLIQLLSLATLANSGQDAYIAYRYGNYLAAREALLKHIELLRETGPGDGARSQSFDIMFSYARLATLAEKAEKTGDGKEFWRRAMESRSPTGHPATEEEVRQAVERLDASWDQRLSP